MIRYKAFTGYKLLESIILTSASYIDIEAFYECVALTKIESPKATKIAVHALQDHTALQDIKLLMVTEVDSGAFTRCASIETIHLSESKVIGENVFSECTELKVAIIPEVTPESLDENLFSDCDKLEIDILPDSFFTSSTKEQGKRKELLVIWKDAKCIKYSDYIQNSSSRIDGL